MRIECPNQTATLTFDIQRRYPLIWTETEEGKRIDEFSVDPVEGEVELSVETIIVDTGDLPITAVLRVMKAIEGLNKKERLNKRISRANYAAGYDDAGKPYAIELKKNTEIRH